MCWRSHSASCPNLTASRTITLPDLTSLRRSNTTLLYLLLLPHFRLPSYHTSDFSVSFSLDYTFIYAFQFAWKFYTHNCFCGTSFPKAWVSQWIDMLQNKNKTEHHTGLKPSYSFLKKTKNRRMGIGHISSCWKTKQMTALSSDMSLSRGRIVFALRFCERSQGLRKFRWNLAAFQLSSGSELACFIWFGVFSALHNANKWFFLSMESN